MASSYSTDLKLELMVTGENAGTWGDKTNTNLNLVQQAIAGYEAVALSDGGTVALAMSDAALSNARNMILKFTGTLTTASTVTIPDGIEKFYIIDLSAVTGVTNLTIKTVSGTGFTAGEAAIVAAYSDGTNLNEIALNTLGGTIATAQIDDAAISTAKLSDNAVTTAKISNLNVTEAKLAASAVTADKIAQSTITQAKLATDSVGANQLISTGVTAAEYTSATITVDADGRITAASSGSAGDTNLAVAKSVRGPESGTYTANPATTKINAYLVGGGGGSGGVFQNNPGPAKGGGAGGFGMWSTTISAPYSVPYSVGAAGNGGSGNTPSGPGNAGGATSLDSFTANGGAGGPGSGTGFSSNGNAPGATVVYVDNSVTPSGGPAANLNGAQFLSYGDDKPDGASFTAGARANPRPKTPSVNVNGYPGGQGMMVIYENNIG